ncbi:MAG: hypothetical protein AAF456_25860, partial [Planctomycetota bacterium]
MNAIPAASAIGASEDGVLLRRICDHFSIAFSANMLAPALADYQQSEEFQNEIVPSDLNRLNAAGRAFGIRFRDMEGSLRDLVNSVSDSGPVVVSSGDNEFRCLVVSVGPRSRLTIHVNGSDEVVSVRWLQRQLNRKRGQSYRWILVQPMLAAGSASTFHYRFGKQQGKIRPLKRLYGLLKPEAQDVRTILIFSIVTGLLSLTT